MPPPRGTKNVTVKMTQQQIADPVPGGASRAAASPTTSATSEDRRPQLVVAFSKTSGQSRRLDAFLALVLQRRRNHDSFRLIRLDVGQSPELAKRLGVEKVPTLVVIEHRKIAGRLVEPSDVRAIQAFLKPWLR
jgi:thioredoxin-like negative regulator of GroEL